MELVDTTDLGSVAARREGSNPLGVTMDEAANLEKAKAKIDACMVLAEELRVMINDLRLENKLFRAILNTRPNDGKHRCGLRLNGNHWCVLNYDLV